jgi:hypothetical protein
MGVMDNAITSSKSCFKCGQKKARTEFYRHPQMGDGLLGKCKQCTKADSNAHRLANLEKVREYDRQRSKLPERLKLAALISARWRNADARRLKCHNAVAKAVRSGRLLRQPCSVCGSPKSEAHHESYDRPLDVVWYCSVHHKARHKEMAIDGIEP